LVLAIGFGIALLLEHACSRHLCRSLAKAKPIRMLDP